MVMWRARAGALRSCGRAGSRTARSSPLGPPRSEPPSTTQAIPTGPGGLAHCDDVPKLASSFEGTLSGRQNPDPVIKRALSAYGREHPDTYAGQWIDRDNGGGLMMGFNAGATDGYLRARRRDAPANRWSRCLPDWAESTCASTPTRHRTRPAPPSSCW